jgi:hypothetical protein
VSFCCHVKTATEPIDIVRTTLEIHLKNPGVPATVNDWALAHQRKLVVAIFAVVGVSLMAQGMGGA